MQSAILHVIGPSTVLLANYLSTQQGWHVDQVQQLTTQRGIIVGRHDTPEAYAGVGINDGTRVQQVEIPDGNEGTE